MGGAQALEVGEGGGGQGCGVRWGRAPGDFCEEGAQPAGEGEDAQDGAERCAKVRELLCYGDHCC